MPLIRYAYDPLNRLIANLSDSQASPRQHFYNHERLSVLVQGEHSQAVFQHQHVLLAEKRTTGTQLLATDAKRSVLHALSGSDNHAQAYSAYGHPRRQSGQQSLLGFNGEACDPLTGHSLLGNGHRGYNPVLMRFNSPDALSPFDKGGVNAYAYCSGDPVNRSDPNGRFWGVNVKSLVSGFLSLISVGVATMPAVGFRESFVALKRGAYTLDHIVKVATTSAAFISASTSTARASLLNPEGMLGESLHWASTVTSTAALVGNLTLVGRDFVARRALRNTEALVDSERVTRLAMTTHREAYELQSVVIERNTVTTTSQFRLRSPSPHLRPAQDAVSIRNAR